MENILSTQDNASRLTINRGLSFYVLAMEVKNTKQYTLYMISDERSDVIEVKLPLTC